MEPVTINREDLARLFIVGALNSRDMKKGLADAESHEVATMVELYHALLVTVERTKAKLGFPAEMDAVEAATTLINQQVWKIRGENFNAQ